MGSVSGSRFESSCSNFMIFLYMIFLLLFFTNTEICFVIVFDSFILVTILNTVKFKSFVLFGTYILSQGPSRVLQLPLQISKLTLNE